MIDFINHREARPQHPHGGVALSTFGHFLPAGRKPMLYKFKKICICI